MKRNSLLRKWTSVKAGKLLFSRYCLPSFLLLRGRLDPVLTVERHAAAVVGHQVVGGGHARHHLGWAARAGNNSCL